MIPYVILIALCLAYFVIGFVVDTPDYSHLTLMGYLGWFQLIYSIKTWLERDNKFISPYVLFLTALYIFSFGQSLVYPIPNAERNDLVGFMSITTADVFTAQLYTLAFLAFFHIGALAACRKKKNVQTLSLNTYLVKSERKNIVTIGWILFAISILPYYQSLMTNFMLSMARGYGAIFEQDAKIGLDNISTFFSDLFIPSLICLFVGYKDSRSTRLMIEGLMLFNILIILMTGGRTSAVIQIALILVMHNYLVKAFSKKMIIIVGIGGFVLLSVLSYISDTRAEIHRDRNSADIVFSQSSAISAINEMGGSMFCIIKTHDLVPETEDYRYGKSYLYSFTTLIPNLGFWAIHPAKKEANLGEWLSNRLNTSYGTGFSMCAEAYINFGLFGVIIFMFMGVAFSSFFGAIETEIKKENYPYVVFVLIIFWVALKLPRNSFIGFVRPVFFYALPILWLSRRYVFAKKKRLNDKFLLRKLQ